MAETALLRPTMARLEREKPLINTAKNTVAAILLTALALSACVALMSDSSGELAAQNSHMITPARYESLQEGDGEAAPADDEAAPADDEAAPADGEAAPADDEAAPADDEAAPADDEAAPADDEAAPADDASADDSADAPAEAPGGAGAEGESASGDAGAEESANDGKKSEETGGEEAKKGDGKNSADGGKGKKPVVKNDDEMNILGSQWGKKHPNASKTMTTWQWGGGIVCFLGIALLLYSEVSTIRFYRYKDEIKEAADFSNEAALPEQFHVWRLWWGNWWQAQYRGLLTLSGMVVMLIGTVTVFVSECPMINDIKTTHDVSKTSYAGNCVGLALMMSVVATVGLASLIAAVAWCCTRVYASVALVVVAVLCDVIPGHNPVMFLVWVAVTTCLAGGYLYWESQAVEEKEADSSLDPEKREYA